MIKDAATFESGEGICYAVNDTLYTRADFLRVANGEIAIAEKLFAQADGQTPETLFSDEASTGKIPVYRVDPVSHWHWLEVYEYLGDEQRTLLWNNGWKWRHYRQQYGTNIRFAKVPYGIAYVNGGTCDYSAERAGRLEDRADNHRATGERARQRSHGLVEHIPLGQPILPGKRGQVHRNTLERSRNLMSRSIGELDTAEHLDQEAEASRNHQSRKQAPGQIYRRIERLKADKRSYQRDIQRAPERGNQGFIPEWERRLSLLDEEITQLEADLAAVGGILADQIEVNVGDILNIDGFIVQVSTKPRRGGKTFNCVVLSTGSPLVLERSTLRKKLYTAQEWAELKKSNQEAAGKPKPLA